jgi:hypothetical protein
MLRFKEFRREYPEFMPSSSVKHLWLSTFKKEANIQSATMPGLFQSVNYSLLLAGVFFILILEIGATTIAYRYGVSWGAIGAAILVDFGLALISHWNHSKICETKNILFIEEKRQIRDQLNRELGSLKRLKWVFCGLIMLSGFFKFYWFYIVYRIFLIPFGISTDAYTILVFCCYFFGAILHILCTGYVLFTSYFHYRIHKEETKYIYLSNNNKDDKEHGLDDLFESEAQPRPINSNVELVPATVGRHKLYKNDENNQYILETTGVLLDEELRQIIDKQHNAEQRATLANQGIKVQLAILKM